MKIKTTRFGVIEIRKSDVILMKGGILGFEQLKQYALLCQDLNNPFLWFQSLDDGATAFVVINPFFLKPDYQPELSNDTVENLELETPEDVALMAIVTIRSNLSILTANLRAPIVINVTNRSACQVVLEDNLYPIRFDITKNLETISNGLSNFYGNFNEKIPCCQVIGTKS